MSEQHAEVEVVQDQQPVNATATDAQTEETAQQKVNTTGSVTYSIMVNDGTTNGNDPPAYKSSSTYCFALHNVTYEIFCSSIREQIPILELVTETSPYQEAGSNVAIT